MVLAVLCPAAWGDVPIDEEHFPDEIFRLYLSYMVDADGDDSLSNEEIAAKTSIAVSDLGITSLKGIEYFTELRGLDCSVNSLDVLDLSNNNQLLLVYCNDNSLESLNLSGCSSLAKLNCSGNNLTSLNVSDSTTLMELYCSGNSIEALDLTDKVYLVSLDCSGNNLSALDVGDSAFMSMLDCHDNHIQELDLSNNTRLVQLDCQTNTLDVLDLSNNTRLETCICRSNNLVSLDLSNCRLLGMLDCAKNSLTELDLSGKTILTAVYCFRNQLTTLNIEGCTYLLLLHCFYNKLSSLDASDNIWLVDLECNNNLLTSLNVDGCTKLYTLWCWTNRLKSLDLTTNTELVSLACRDNNILELDLTQNVELDYLDCQINGLSTLDVSKNTKLTTIYCRTNVLQEIDLSKNTALKHLDCNFNLLKALDLSNNIELISLDCTSNDISALDLSANTSLEHLDCAQNFVNLYVMPSGKSDYPFKMNMAEYAIDDLSRVTSITAYSSSGAVIASNFDRAEKVLFLTAKPHHVVYEYDVRYSGTAQDVPSRMPVTIEMYMHTFEVPGGLKWLTNAVMTDEVLNAAANAFTGMSVSDVRRFNSIIIDEGWTLESSDIQPLLQELPRMGQELMFSLPETQADSDGVYVILCFPNSDVKSSDKLSVYNFNEDGSVSEADYAFIDEGGNVVESPGNNRMLYLAMKFTAGQVNRNVLTYSGNSSQSSGSTGSSGGGCDSGVGVLALLGVGILVVGRKRRVWVLVMMAVLVLAQSEAFAEVKASDYLLPIPFEMYTPGGTCTTDFEFTAEIAEKVAEGFRNRLNMNVTPSDVHSYADIALPGTWTLKPGDIRNLAQAGQYGAALLPLTPSGTSDDFYVALCTFSDDVEPGERIQIYGLTIDTELRENVSTIDMDSEEYTSDAYSGGYYVLLDENMNIITSVPKNKRAYIAVSLFPYTVNTAVITVDRGRYITEDDPLSRVHPSLAQFIADSFNISVDELKYLSYEYLSAPREATEAMKSYVASEDREIFLNMPTVSIDEGFKAAYFVYTLPDDVWEEVKDKPISDYTVYALNDTEVSESGFGQFRSSFILNGVVSLWELSGGKMDKFGVKEFVIAGLLQAGRPFSFYLAKILLALLLGGCSSGINPAIIPIVILGVIALKFPRRR